MKRLRELAETSGGLAVIAILRPADLNGASLEPDKKLDFANLGKYAIYFYSLHEWKRITPYEK